MCLDEYGLRFVHTQKFKNWNKDMCNKRLSLNRGLVCQALNVVKSNNSGKVLRCLDGNSPCGLMGMLWKKYLGDNIMVHINGIFPHSPEVIMSNLESNNLEAHVEDEPTCILLRRKCYDFIYLDCKTSAAIYFDSLFVKVNKGGVIVITTSDDPSLYWQSPDVALRRYGGSIVKTSYFRELGVRLVLAEMARAAARYSKGINVLFSVAFKEQQSFTVVVRVDRGAHTADETLKKVQRLVHCSVCEDRAFIPNSEFALERVSSLLSCDCSKNSVGRTVNELGPVWSGEIFSPDFIESMLSQTKKLPWENSTKLLLLKILEEAKCDGRGLELKQSNGKKIKMDGRKVEEEEKLSCSHPSFYFCTHRHHPGKQPLRKVMSVVRILHNDGFRASRTHFDPESVRTNASLRELIRLLDENM